MRHSAIRLEHASRGGPAVQAFAPGRVNLVGEHTDYNDGLCLPFAIDRGVTVAADPAQRRGDRGACAGPVRARSLRAAVPTSGRAARAPAGAASCAGRSRSCSREGIEVRPCRLRISGDVPRGAGLSSSAALSVSLCLALCAVAGAEPPGRVELARLCSRIEREWCGADTGLLDQLASLFGERGRALRIDMRGPAIESVPLELAGHVLATLDSGAERSVAASGYNERRAECRAACRALGVDSLRDADGHEGLPEPLGRRVRHVLTENERVDAAVGGARGRRPGRAGTAARRLPPEPPRRLRGVGARGGAGRRGMQGGRGARSADHGRRFRGIRAGPLAARGRAAAGAQSGRARPGRGAVAPLIARR